MSREEFPAAGIPEADLNLLHDRIARSAPVPLSMELVGAYGDTPLLCVRSDEPLTGANAEAVAGILAAWGPTPRAEEEARRLARDWRARLARRHAGKTASQLTDADLLEWARARMAEDLGLAG